MDAVVCVSEAMAQRVRHAGVNPYKVTVIRNALDTPAIVERDVSTPGYRGIGRLNTPVLTSGHQVLTSERRYHRRKSVGSVPKRASTSLSAAAAIAVRVQPDYRFVVFGEGPMRPVLEDLIRREGLTGRFVFGGISGRPTNRFAKS
jgi:glycosyltransferase involved in cell wall biosynthesis